MKTLVELYQILQRRMVERPYGSYTVHLIEQGLPRIAQKVGEEAIETILAAYEEEPQRLVEEIADLLYHLLVLMAYKGVTLDDVERELERRRK